jgi:hypothetical protein
VVTGKLRAKHGTVRRLADSSKSPSEVIDELYLAALARFPTERERTIMLEAFRQAADDRRGAVEDVLWALLNSKEYIYNH